MAKTETTVRGYVYTVTSPNGGTVTDAEGKLNKPVDAGDQVTVQAPSDSLTCSDDDAVIYKANFKSPLLVLRLLGQGETALPAGYTRLEFLESTGTQYINTEIVPSNLHGLMTETLTKTGGRVACLGSRNSQATDTRVFCPDNRPGYTIGYGWGGWIDLDYNVPQKRRIYYLNYRNSRIATAGEKIAHSLPELAFVPTQPMYLFSVNVGGQPNSNFIGRVWAAAISYGKSIIRQYVPALDKSGEPCMFDLVSKQPFSNAGSGQFVAGVGTVAQLTALLRNLPATGGTLTLSLPAEANTPEVADMLQACHDSKGWTLTVHEYRPAEAATYSLRRVRSVVWCRRELAEYGSYVDVNGTRWQIDRCAAIFGRLGNDPTAYGYTPFNSVDEAAAHWELQPYVDPNAMGDNGTLEQGDTENTSPTTNS